jgi:transposase
VPSLLSKEDRMATTRLPMRHVREILRLKWKQGLSYRETSIALRVSVGAVGSVLARAKAKELDWQRVSELSDDELEVVLYGPKLGAGQRRPLPDPEWMHTELRRKGVTLELLHLEYLEEHPDGYRYTSFCDHYRRWLKKRRLSMRQVHKAGEKTFVDYSGKKPEIVDPSTGEVRDVELFVAALGASNLIFAEATLTQRSRDWIGSHGHTFEYFGGVTALVVPDQLKSGVASPCRYEPEVQRIYAEWARHFDTAVLPARQGKPRDKAKVETAVQVAQRWILARLRDETFFSLGALNRRIAELLEELNGRPMKDYGGLSRRQLFEKLERDELRPLPVSPFVFAEWKEARVNIDYHIAFDEHFYSVPHPLVREAVEVRATGMTVEVYHRGKRVASHVRSSLKGRHTTAPDHMPKSHQKHLAWTPSRLISWAGTIGPQTQQLVTVIIESRPHPEQGYRSCLGVMRLAKTYSPERLEAACARALAAGARSYRHVKSILKNGLDRVALEEPSEVNTHRVIEHENVRGPNYYKGEEE